MNKNIRKLALSGFAIACLTSSAYADSTYILQLGTSDTKEKAEQKWQELQTQNPDVLKSLKVHISEVAMQADDKVSYRTQAGPIASQSDAQQLCSKLLDKGNECYVIETAMFASDTAADENTVALSSRSQPNIEPLPTHDFAASEPQSAPKTVAIRNTQQAAATPRNLIVPARAPHFLDEDDTAAQSAPPQAKPEPVVAKAAPSEPPSSEAEEKPAPRKATKKAKRQVAQNEETRTIPAATKSSDIVVPDRAPKFLDDDGEERETAANAPDSTATPLAVVTPVAVPQPGETTIVKEEESKPGFFGRLFGSSSSEKKQPPAPETAATEPAPEEATTKSKEVVGNVSVAEAIRVPLSTEKSSASAAPARKKMAEAQDNAQDSTSYWVQITYFADEHQAHYFYEDFRNAYPDISDDVRMRITRSKNDGAANVTLRLGTFTNPAYINAVCSLAAKHSLHCTKTVAGNSTPNIFRSGAENESFLAPSSGENTFWVQLGTFDSSEEAWNKWQAIKGKEGELVSGTGAIITTPAVSTGNEKRFRLRTGPFSDRSTAGTLCSKLTQDGETCSVTTE